MMSYRLQPQEQAYVIKLINEANESQHVPQTQDHQIGTSSGVDIPAFISQATIDGTHAVVPSNNPSPYDPINTGTTPGQMNSTGKAIQNPLWKPNYTSTWLSS